MRDGAAGARADKAYPGVTRPRTPGSAVVRAERSNKLASNELLVFCRLVIVRLGQELELYLA